MAGLVGAEGGFGVLSFRTGGVRTARDAADPFLVLPSCGGVAHSLAGGVRSTPTPPAGEKEDWEFTCCVQAAAGLPVGDSCEGAPKEAKSLMGDSKTVLALPAIEAGVFPAP